MNADQIKDYILSTKLETCEICHGIPPCPHISSETYDRVLMLSRILRMRSQLSTNYFEARKSLNDLRRDIRLFEL